MKLTDAEIVKVMYVLSKPLPTEEEVDEIVTIALKFKTSEVEEVAEVIRGARDWSSQDDKATVAEAMLDQYHMLKTNLRVREAIHRALHDREASGPRTATAYQMIVQAQAELDQCKFEILELMGVDS